MIGLVFAILTAVASLLTGYVQSRSAEKAGVQRADFGYDLLRSKSEQHDKAISDLTTIVREQRDWMAAYIGAQQVSAPVVPSPSTPPVVVMAQAGSEAPAKRTLTPLSHSLPPLPTVQAAPSPAALPRSLNELVKD